MGLRTFLYSWNDIAAKTEFEIVSEYFCRLEVGVRIFLSEERREENFGLRIFLSKKVKGRKGIGLRIVCRSKR